MIDVMQMPTERPDTRLVEMVTEGDDAAWVAALRTEPHPLSPDHPDAPDHRLFNYLPMLRETSPGSRHLGIRDGNGIVGEIVRYAPENEDPTAVELAYKVAPGHEGNGYATVALRALAPHAQAQPGVKSVFLEINADNPASQRVAAKAGFRPTDKRRDPDTGKEYLVFTYAGEGTQAAQRPSSQRTDRKSDFLASQHV